jgi:hypothetical protein
MCSSPWQKSYHAWPAKIIDHPVEHPIGLIVNTLSAVKYHRTVSTRFGHLAETVVSTTSTMRTCVATYRNDPQHSAHISILGFKQCRHSR